jgi:hypothetical protein
MTGLLCYDKTIKRRRNAPGGSFMAVERTEFKGQPVIVLKRNDTDKYPFSFGLSKARLIIEYFDEIKKFVAEADNKNEEKK